MAGESRSERDLRRKIEAAQVSASVLKGKGYHFEAEQVLILCRAASGILTTARQQFAELQELRQRKTDA